METYLDTIYDEIMSITDYDELLKYKIKLEVSPFCGVQYCYDLERLVFSKFTQKQSANVLDHIRKLGIGRKQTYHIFTTFEYYRGIPEYIRVFINKHYNYITILSSNKEVNEIVYRSTRDNVSIISELTIDTKFDNIEYRNTILADMLVMSINNYSKIFPEFIPIFIDKYSDVTKFVKNKVEICLLEGDNFRTEAELMAHFYKILQKDSQLPLTSSRSGKV
jgi:hypothetical protein